MSQLNSTVSELGQSIIPTGSFLQGERFHTVSSRFQPIQPSLVASRLEAHGFQAVSLLTGRSRHEDKVDFQRTISRFRETSSHGIDGLHVDVIYISKHMGRGQDEIRLGLYRGLCANQWTAGTIIETIKIRHTGNAWSDLEEGLIQIVAQRNKFLKVIEEMRKVKLTYTQAQDLARSMALTRLEKVTSLNTFSSDALLNFHREGDQGNDLFTVMNVIQENVIRFPVGYTVNSRDRDGNPVTRNQTTRRLKESSGSLVALNAALFDRGFALLPVNVQTELRAA